MTVDANDAHPVSHNTHTACISTNHTYETHCNAAPEGPVRQCNADNPTIQAKLSL